MFQRTRKRDKWNGLSHTIETSIYALFRIILGGRDEMCVHAYLPFRSCVKCNRHIGVANLNIYGNIFFCVCVFFPLQLNRVVYRLLVQLLRLCVKSRISLQFVWKKNKGFKLWQILNLKLRPFHLTFDDKQYAQWISPVLHAKWFWWCACMCSREWDEYSLFTEISYIVCCWFLMLVHRQNNKLPFELCDLIYDVCSQSLKAKIRAESHRE